MDSPSPTSSTAHSEKHPSPSPSASPRPPPLSRVHSTQPLSPAAKEKLSSILNACAARDRPALVDLALSEDGLVTDEVRRSAWPCLLGYSASSAAASRPPWKNLPPHPDESQVGLDVNRAFIYYPTHISPRLLSQRKLELSALITEVLRRHPQLSYFQGFHDICQVFLLVLGPEAAVAAVEHISLLRIRDFMLPSMTPSLLHLRLLPPLLHRVDPKLCKHLSTTQPFFALAATLTLYAHDIQEYADIARLFDVFLAMPPVFPIYLFAEIVRERREELFEIPDDEPEMLHSVLSKLPRPLDLEGMVGRAVALLREVPVEGLAGWRGVGSASVLRKEGQDLEEGEKLLAKQCQELEWEKRRKVVWEVVVRNKVPLLMGVSVVVAVLGVVLARKMN